MVPKCSQKTHCCPFNSRAVCTEQDEALKRSDVWIHLQCVSVFVQDEITWSHVTVQSQRCPVNTYSDRNTAGSSIILWITLTTVSSLLNQWRVDEGCSRIQYFTASNWAHALHSRDATPHIYGNYNTEEHLPKHFMACWRIKISF